MTEMKFADPGGATMRLLNVNDRYIVPDMTSEQWTCIFDMKTRSDDVFICSYPKSGTHWLWDILTMLRRGDASPVGEHMTNYIMDFSFSTISKLESHPPPRVLTTHRFYEELPVQARKDRCKIVYVLRDPRDVAVSYYHHLTKTKPLGYEGKLEDFLQLFMDGRVLFNSWWEHVLRWSEVTQQHPDQPLLMLHYEDMKKDPETAVRRLADFVKVQAGDDLIRDIVHNTSFEVMKQQKESLNFHLDGRYKGGTNIFYRKGEANDWKNWLTEERWKAMTDFFKAKLASANLGAFESAQQYF